MPVSRRKLIAALATGAIGGAALVSSLKSLPEVKVLTLSGNPNYVEFITGSGASTPASGSLRLSAKTADKMPYIIDDSGVETIAVTRQTASYIIELIGSTYYARPAPNSGLSAYSDASAVTVIQDALNALPSTGGVIYLKEAVSADGLVTINKSNVTIECSRRQTSEQLSIPSTPYIRQVKIDASAGAIVGVILQGINMKELDFYANGHEIRAASVDWCGIQKDSTYHGVVFQGDGTANSWIDDVSFRESHLVCTGTDGTTWGVVTWTNAAHGMTHFVFNNCTFEGYDNNQSFFLCNGDSRIDSMTVNKCRFYHDTGTTGDYVFYQKTASQNTYPTGFEAIFTDNYVETAKTLTLIYAETRGPYWPAGLDFAAIGNHFEISTGGSVTLMTYADGADAAWGQEGVLIFEGNKANTFGAPGTFSIGTPPDPTVLTRIIKNNSPLLYVSQNQGTSTQNGTGSATAFTIAHGLSAVPSTWVVTKNTNGLPGIEYVTANATNLTVNFTTAPASGTSNVVMNWSAQV